MRGKYIHREGMTERRITKREKREKKSKRERETERQKD